MRIVQVSPFYYPHAGGVESHVRGLAREFAREGHEVTVLTSRYRRHLPAEESFEGYRVLRSRSLGVLLGTPLDIGGGRILRATRRGKQSDNRQDTCYRRDCFHRFLLEIRLTG